MLEIADTIHKLPPTRKHGRSAGWTIASLYAASGAGFASRHLRAPRPVYNSIWLEQRAFQVGSCALLKVGTTGLPNMCSKVDLHSTAASQILLGEPWSTSHTRSHVRHPSFYNRHSELKMLSQDRAFIRLLDLLLDSPFEDTLEPPKSTTNIHAAVDWHLQVPIDYRGLMSDILSTYNLASALLQVVFAAVFSSKHNLYLHFTSAEVGASHLTLTDARQASHNLTQAISASANPHAKSSPPQTAAFCRTCLHRLHLSGHAAHLVWWG